MTPRLLALGIVVLALGAYCGVWLTFRLVFWRSGAEPVDDGWRDLERVDCV